MILLLKFKSYLPLAVRWWAGAPAALRPLARWWRWPCLGGNIQVCYRCVVLQPWTSFYVFFSHVSLTKVLSVDLLVCLEMGKDNVRGYDTITLWQITYPDFILKNNKRSIRRKEYPLQPEVHECVSTRNLPFQRVQPLPDVYSAERKHGWISFDLPHLSSLSVQHLCPSSLSAQTTLPHFAHLWKRRHREFYFTQQRLIRSRYGQGLLFVFASCVFLYVSHQR